MAEDRAIEAALKAFYDDDDGFGRAGMRSAIAAFLEVWEPSFDAVSRAIECRQLGYGLAAVVKETAKAEAARLRRGAP